MKRTCKTKISLINDFVRVEGTRYKLLNPQIVVTLSLWAWAVWPSSLHRYNSQSHEGASILGRCVISVCPVGWNLEKNLSDQNL